MPKSVIIDLCYLATLPPREIDNGVGEMVKFACIAGPTALAVMKNNLHNFEVLIRLGLYIKRAVVEVDPYDEGPRLSLNLGHTIGHALEAVTKYKIPHGVAVALGIEIMRQTFGKSSSIFTGDYMTILAYLVERRRVSLQAILCKYRKNFNVQMHMCMQQDKKNKNGLIAIIVPSANGDMELQYYAEVPSIYETLQSIIQ
jgi:3-dehydroquinate synthetase